MASPLPRPVPTADDLGAVLARNGFTDPQLAELARAAVRRGVPVALSGAGELVIGAVRVPAAAGPRWAV